MPEYNEFFWQKVQEDEFWLQKCGCCNRYIFYPRSLCPHCWQQDLNWVRVSGRGRVYSYTVVHVSALPEFINETPYYYVLIDLEEGVRIAGTIIDCENKVYPGMPVEVQIIQKNGRALPVFKPVGEE